MLGHRPAVARVSIELTTSALWARRSEPAELSRHGWPPRNRTARYLRIRPRRPAGSWPADGGGPDPQRSRALPGSSRSPPPGRFTIQSGERKSRSPATARPPVFETGPAPRQVHSPRRKTWTLSTGSSQTPLAFQAVTAPGGFIFRERRAEQSKPTALPAHSLAARPGTLSGSLSVKRWARDRRIARRCRPDRP